VVKTLAEWEAAREEEYYKKLYDSLSSDTVLVSCVSPEAKAIQVILRQLKNFDEPLTDREDFIFCNRLIAKNPLTLQEIGDRFGVTHEQVFQIEKRLMDKLCSYLKSKLPEYFGSGKEKKIAAAALEAWKAAQKPWVEAAAEKEVEEARARVVLAAVREEEWHSDQAMAAAQLQDALRRVLPMAEAWFRREFDGLCDHEPGECTCGHEAHARTDLDFAIDALGRGARRRVSHSKKHLTAENL